MLANSPGEEPSLHARRFYSPTLLERYAKTLQSSPNRPALVWVDRKGAKAASYTYRQLDLKARGVAQHLFDAGITRGEAVLLAYSPGLDFFVAFWGCLLGGIVPVPVAPPISSQEVGKFLLLYKHSEAKAILTDKRYARLIRAKAYKEKASQVGQGVRALLGTGNREKKRPRFLDLTAERWLTTTGVPAAVTNVPMNPQGALDTAFIMYSSGSTSAPKGALTSFANLNHQLEMNGLALGASADNVSCWWAPHYHDYGLISGFLNVVYQGCRGILASPFDFIQRPALWLDMLHSFGGTHTFGPDFGYELLIRKTRSVDRQNRKWDLATLKVAMSAAEKVRASTIDAFSAAFATCGFQRQAFCPAYGLAEHTVGATISGLGSEPVIERVLREPLEKRGEALPANLDDNFDDPEDDRILELVGNGVARYETDLKIVSLNADGEPRKTMPPGYVGEIWLSSESKTNGYFKDPVLTKASFMAHLPHATEPKAEYLRTGDLGFISVTSGELFICGRHKDMIILAGKNHYSEDFEVTLSRSTSRFLRPGRIAAFSFDEAGTNFERLAIVAEVRSPDFDHASVFGIIQSSLREEHKVNVSTIALIESGSIPKTSSGKLRRFEAREKLANNTLRTIPNGVWIAPVSSLENERNYEETLALILQGLVAHRGSSGNIGPSTPLASLGLSSLELAQLADAINAGQPQASLRVQDLLGLETVAEVAELCMNAKGTKGSEVGLPLPPLEEYTQTSHNEICTLAHPTLFAQESVLKHHFLGLQQSGEWNIPLSAWLSGTICLEYLQEAFVWLAMRQAALRTVFELGCDGTFAQRVQESWNPGNFVIETVSSDTEAYHRAREIAAAPLDVRRTCIKVHVLQIEPRRLLMVVVIHHAICDGWSVGVFRNDLVACYDAIQRGANPENLKLQPLAHQLVDLAHWQQGLLQNHVYDQRLGFWKKYLQSPVPHLKIPADRNPGASLEGTRACIELPASVVRDLRAVSTRWQTSTNVIFLTAYAAVLSRRYRQKEILVQLPVAGRPPGSEGIIGGCADSTLVRVSVPRETSYQAMVKENHRSFYDALEHEVPFALLSQAADLPPVELSRLSWVVLNLEQNVSHRARGSSAFGGGAIEATRIPSTETVTMPAFAHSVMDLNISEDGQLIGEWKCKTSLIPQSELQALAKRFERMLHAVSQSRHEGPALEATMQMRAITPEPGFNSSALFSEDPTPQNTSESLSFPALVGDGSSVITQEFRLLPELIGAGDLFSDTKVDTKIETSNSAKPRGSHSSSDLFADES